MSWLTMRRVQIQRFFKKLTTAATAFMLASGSVLAIVPATAAHAIDQPSAATLNKAAGTTLSNVELLSGTVADDDGVASVTVRFIKVSNASASGLVAASVVSGAWSLQLSKSLVAIQPDITDANVQVEVTVTDDLANSTSFVFGPFSYVVPGTETFQAIVATIASLDPADCAVTQALQTNGAVTVFGPNNEALAALPLAELQALQANPDELCAVLATHILGGRVESGDVTGPVAVTPENPNNLPLEVAPENGTVTVNGSTVVNADNNINSTSILHVINSLINPESSAVSISDIYTNITSPALFGTVGDPNYKVAVRINGVQYEATNNGDGTWSIPAGVVILDPTNSATLFSVIAREQGTPTTSNPSGLFLVGISIRSNVLQYVQPGSGSGEVAGASTTNLLASVASVVSEVVDSADNLGATSSTSTTTTEEPKDDSSQQSPQENTAETKKANNQWYWWIIGIATLGALYYILGGSTPPTTTSKKK